MKKRITAILGMLALTISLTVLSGCFLFRPTTRTKQLQGIYTLTSIEEVAQNTKLAHNWSQTVRYSDYTITELSTGLLEAVYIDVVPDSDGFYRNAWAASDYSYAVENGNLINLTLGEDLLAREKITAVIEIYDEHLSFAYFFGKEKIYTAIYRKPKVTATSLSLS